MRNFTGHQLRIRRSAQLACGKSKTVSQVGRRCHQYHAQQAHQRWHAYADELPQLAIYNCRISMGYLGSGGYARSAGLT